MKPDNSEKDSDQKRRGAGFPLWSGMGSKTFLGLNLPGAVASLGFVAVLIGGTALVGSRLNDQSGSKAGVLRAGHRLAPDYSRVKTDAAAELPTENTEEDNSLGMLVSANNSATEANAQGDIGAGQAAGGAQAGNENQGAGDVGADASAPDQSGTPGSGNKRLASLSPLSRSGGAAGGGASVVSAPNAGPVKGVDASQVQAFARPVESKARKTAVGVGGRGANRSSLGRLSQMNKALKPTAGMPGQQAAAYQTAAWEAQPAKGQSVSDTGAGISPISGPRQDLDGPSADAGGPIQDVKKQSYQAPKVQEAKNVTPWQSMSTMAGILIMISGLLLMAASLVSKANPISPIPKYLAYAAAALAAAVTVLGIIIMTVYGQTTQGLIYTGVGALLTALSIMAANSFSKEAANAPAATNNEAIKLGADMHPKLSSRFEGILRK